MHHLQRSTNYAKSLNREMKQLHRQIHKTMMEKVDQQKNADYRKTCQPGEVYRLHGEVNTGRERFPFVQDIVIFEVGKTVLRAMPIHSFEIAALQSDIVIQPGQHGLPIDSKLPYVFSIGQDWAMTVTKELLKNCVFVFKYDDIARLQYLDDNLPGTGVSPSAFDREKKVSQRQLQALRDVLSEDIFFSVLFSQNNALEARDNF